MPRRAGPATVTLAQREVTGRHEHPQVHVLALQPLLEGRRGALDARRWWCSPSSAGRRDARRCHHPRACRSRSAAPRSAPAPGQASTSCRRTSDRGSAPHRDRRPRACRAASHRRARRARARCAPRAAPPLRASHRAAGRRPGGSSRRRSRRAPRERRASPGRGQALERPVQRSHAPSGQRPERHRRERRPKARGADLRAARGRCTRPCSMRALTLLVLPWSVPMPVVV